MEDRDLKPLDIRPIPVDSGDTEPEVVVIGLDGVELPYSALMMMLGTGRNIVILDTQES